MLKRERGWNEWGEQHNVLANADVVTLTGHDTFGNFVLVGSGGTLRSFRGFQRTTGVRKERRGCSQDKGHCPKWARRKMKIA